MTSTYSHAFGCDISQAVFHAEVNIEHEVEGQYVLREDLIGTPQGNAVMQACVAYNEAHAAGADQGFWGTTPQGNCQFEVTQEAYVETIPAYNDPAAIVANEPGAAINQSQTDGDVASFEEHGGIVQVTAEYHVGQVVICNSPGSKGGTWRVQNGYNGGSFAGPAAGCNTPYFKIAPWGSGSQTSNGTFTSVPNYNF